MRADNSLIPKRIYEFGDFRLNTAERVIGSAGQPLSLSPKALDVLIVLVEHRGRIVEKEDLMRKVWPETFVEDNNLAFNISVLRKLFHESGAAPRFIETVPKRGYRFIADVVEVPESALPQTEAPTEHAYVQPPTLTTLLNPRATATILGRLARPWGFVGALLTLTAVGILMAYLPRASKLPETSMLTEKDTVVVADFMNRTGDPVFDGTLHQGLVIQLEQSPSLSLLSEVRTRKMLRLMGQPADARLTGVLARDVCERTASAVVLEGSIASLGSQYVLGLRAQNCSTGEILDDEQAQAAGKEDVLKVVSQIARNFRVRTGESLATLRRHDTPLVEATTSSINALKAYDAALKVHFSTGARAALPLFRRAVEIDPEFAMAHSYLGRMYANLDEPDLAAESTKRAWQLRDRVSDREKFSIATRYEALVTGNVEALRQLCEAWVRTYRRDPQPYMGLSRYDQTAGQYENAVTEAGRALDVDPNFAIGYYDLAVNDVYLGRLSDAENVMSRAVARGLQSEDFVMLAYDIAFLRGDRAGMEQQAARARGGSAGESWILNKEALELAYFGHLEKARSASRRAVDQAQHVAQRERAGLWEAGAALREAFFGNSSEAGKRASAALALSNNREVEYAAALALALSGDSAQSQTLANDLKRRFPDDTSVRFSHLPAVQARLALNRGDTAGAFELLQSAVPYEMGPTRNIFGALYPVYMRGEAFLAAHKGREAAAEFQRIVTHRGIVVSDPVGALARLQLARALVLSGDKTKAKAAYDDFLALWKDADADIPVLKDARTEYAKL